MTLRWPRYRVIRALHATGAWEIEDMWNPIWHNGITYPTRAEARTVCAEMNS